MKKSVIILLVLVGLISSCSLLKEEPKVQITTDDFYKTEADAIAAINGAYASMKQTNAYYRQLYISNMYASSDQGTSSFKHTDYYNGILSSTHSTLTDAWNAIYTSIKDANNVIARVPAIEMNDALKNRIIGEARFLRGLHYFNLVRSFGEVPLRTTPAEQGEDEIGLPTSTVDVVYRQIISDLKFASENCWGLEETVEGKVNEIGRVTNAAAEGLLAKVYLHMASSTRNALIGNEGLKIYESIGSNYGQYYDSAYVYADKALNRPKYALVTNANDYQFIFHSTNGNNREMLFEIQNAPVSGQGSAITNLFTPQGSGLSAGTWGGTNSIKSGFINKNIDKTDQRYLLSIIQEYTANGRTYVINAGKAGYDIYEGEERVGVLYQVYTSKYVDREATSDATAQQNWHVLRLADVHLIRAEAAAEKLKDPSMAEYDINILRERVEMDEFFQGSGMSMNDFRTFIMRERGVELMAEGNRWFDLTRMGMLEELVKSAFDPNNQGLIQGVRGPEDYQWPIPETEKAANENIN
ncbi:MULTISPECIES: RagB/SusD family nutrient uptake outer membrane protein [Flammeovirga]|uniref:RagB/SusD family nutrient uptake outer membrane protein n=1 Tax=Flammeovirga agarivorans TaxID=2726742 RepID=A0A7X8SK62_9BACT|nr:MULTISPECIES: RagB/SusD family nutrient uptake outer membrane protein [Flammeovirga]NLR91755.1 RagB/SusD family nutrient uptake outer membrane protein [Flammeovirga agarivorans]